MPDLQDTCEHKENAQKKASNEGSKVSMRPKSPRQIQQSQSPSSRRRTVNILAAAIAAVAIAGISIYALSRGNKIVPGASVAPAPDASIPPLAAVGSHAKALSLNTPIGVISSTTLQGKPYMIEIFATWCPHCQRMARELRNIRMRIPESRFAMISVTGSPYAANATPENLVPENQEDVNRFDAEYGVTWPSVFDPDLSVARTWGMSGFPTIYIVDAKGVIVYASGGEVREGALLAAIKKAGT